MPEVAEALYFLFTDDTQWLCERWKRKLKERGLLHRVRGAPKFLFRMHQRIVVRGFDGRGMRLRDHVTLGVVRFALNRFELYQFYGRPW